jgi:hypothetical protein
MSERIEPHTLVDGYFAYLAYLARALNEYAKEQDAKHAELLARITALEQTIASLRKETIAK